MDYAMTHKEIAQKLDLSRARVQQLERSAMAKLERALSERGITREVVADHLDNKVLGAHNEW